MYFTLAHLYANTCTNIPYYGFKICSVCILLIVCRSSDQSSPDRVRALEEQLRATELKERETQQCCDKLLLEKDQELGTKNQELHEANFRCAEAQQIAQDAHR